MVATIKLGEQDGSLIMAFHVKLTNVANALYYPIKGPLKWCGRGINNIMHNLLSSILSLDERLDGNWVSAFVRLGPRGEKRMLLNTVTRYVSICIVFDLY